MSPAVHQYQLLPASRVHAPLLATLSHTLVETGLQPSWGAARIRWHIDHSDSVVLTARGPQGIVGFAIMRYLEDAAHLNLLAVLPAHRRRGVARSLLSWLEETALTAGTFTITLEVRARNEGARGFYGRAGYQELGAIPGYYQGMEAAVRMRRDLRLTTPSA
jgi:ribosomal-protein-alanine N-acetyltransferase